MATWVDVWPYDVENVTYRLHGGGGTPSHCCLSAVSVPPDRLEWDAALWIGGRRFFRGSCADLFFDFPFEDPIPLRLMRYSDVDLILLGAPPTPSPVSMLVFDGCEHVEKPGPATFVRCRSGGHLAVLDGAGALFPARLGRNASRLQSLFE